MKMTATTVLALRAHADWLHRLAVGQARLRVPMAPSLTSGEDMTDWRSHLSSRERDVIVGLMADGIWEPQE